MTRLHNGTFWHEVPPVPVSAPVMRLPWELWFVLGLGVGVWSFALVGVRSLLR